MTDPRNPLIAGVTNDASNALDSLLPTSYALNQILSGKVLASNVDANTLTACGKYQFNATTTNVPAGMVGLSGFITVTHERPTPPSNGNFGQAQTISFTPTVIHQVITCNDPMKGMWFRTYASSTWSDWKTVYNDTALSSAVSTLQTNLSAETTNRTNADNTLQTNLTAETTNRTNADRNKENLHKIYLQNGWTLTDAVFADGNGTNRNIKDLLALVNPIISVTSSGNTCWLPYPGDYVIGTRVDIEIHVSTASTITVKVANAAGAEADTETFACDGLSILTLRFEVTYIAGGGLAWSILSTNSVDNTIIRDQVNALELKIVPVGCVLPFMSSSATIPSGFLLCNGAAFSRTTYANLFTSIGTLYGVGDGSTTFAIPDLRGRFLRGYLSGTSAAIGTAQESQNLSHTHGYVDRYPNEGGGISGGSQLQYDTPHNYTTGSSGGTEARPINYACQWIIRY